MACVPGWRCDLEITQSSLLCVLAPTVFDIYGLNCYFITSDYHFKEVFKQRLTFYKLITFISRTESSLLEALWFGSF